MQPTKIAASRLINPHTDLISSISWALFIGRELEQLGFSWLAEPMDEHSMSASAWLAKKRSILIVRPETAEGKLQTRAE
jgi:hypothetical protein